MTRALISSMILSIFALTCVAAAQEKCFGKPKDSLQVQRPQGFVSADFDHDGNPDLAVVSYSHNQHQILSILLGNGDGTFRPSAQYSMYYLGGEVAAGDLNGDGNVDLVVTDWGVDVFLGKGDGTFFSHIHNGGPAVGHVSLGDFNNDGKLDALVSSSTSLVPDYLAVLLGRGDGTFAANQLFPFDNVHGQVVADFNHDSNLDFAVLPELYGGFVEVQLGNGDGTFQSPNGYSTYGLEPYAIVGGDFDEDGNTDIAVANTQSSDIAILRGNGDGSFQAPAKYFARHPYDLVAGDFNGDRHLDLLSVYPGEFATPTMSLLPGNGDGTFQSTVVYVNVPLGVSILTAADFDLDGLTDIATINRDDGHVAVGLNTGDCP